MFRIYVLILAKIGLLSLPKAGSNKFLETLVVTLLKLRKFKNKIKQQQQRKQKTVTLQGKMRKKC